ncbi:nuclear transport factor 2 family protein [Nocardia cyriacigeorgica]|uniref:nuclear transport factor 2 family protein n=1 Tax=Nocardia cyriacigeorgica TaxID=135487 RepID=UPI0018953880|nr:nuclear transport factor 2 family protein [Nocardia cyriacigeorgica]MBF6083824.1 nuclear transport factor 2 family protein [Nocardia cyriacigeorgica]
MTTSPALQTALDYHRAWTGHDFDRAITYLADDLVCEAPSGQITGLAEFRGFMEPFSQIMTSSQLLAAFGDDDTAMLMYDTTTIPVPHAPGAELYSVADGRITHIRIIFDRAPFDAAQAAAANPAS